MEFDYELSSENILNRKTGAKQLTTGKFFEYKHGDLSQFDGNILLKLKPAANTNTNSTTSFAFNVTQELRKRVGFNSQKTILVNIQFYHNNTDHTNPAIVYVSSVQTDQHSSQQQIVPVKFLNINTNRTMAMQNKFGYLIGITFDWIFIDNWVYPMRSFLISSRESKLHVTWNKNTNSNACSAVVESADLIDKS